MGRPQFFNSVERPTDAASRNRNDLTDNVGFVGVGSGSNKIKYIQAPTDKQKRYVSISFHYDNANIPDDVRKVGLSITWVRTDGSQRSILINPGTNAFVQLAQPVVFGPDDNRIEVFLKNDSTKSIDAAVTLNSFEVD